MHGLPTMKLFSHPFLLFSICASTLAVSACDGTSPVNVIADSRGAQNDQSTVVFVDTVNNSSSDIDGGNNFISTNSFSHGFPTGNYAITFSSKLHNSANPDCNFSSGTVALYDGLITGLVNGHVDNSGQVSGSANSHSSLAAAISGHINSKGGSGMWQQDGSCSGTWDMQRINYEQPASAESFTFSPDQIPAALRVRFTPYTPFNKNDVSCASSEGVVNSNGITDSSTDMVAYSGHALTSDGYTSNIHLSISAHSGDVSGSYSYDPLGINGSFTGNAYFAGTPRTYHSGKLSHDNGCEGLWEITVVDIPFSGKTLVSN